MRHWSAFCFFLVLFSWPVVSSSSLDIQLWKQELKTIKSKMNCKRSIEQALPAVHLFRNDETMFIVCESMLKTLFYPFDGQSVNYMNGPSFLEPINEFSSKIERDRKAIERVISNEFERYELTHFSAYERNLLESNGDTNLEKHLRDLWDEDMVGLELNEVWVQPVKLEAGYMFSTIHQQLDNTTFAFGAHLEREFLEQDDEIPLRDIYDYDPRHTPLAFMPGATVATVVDAMDYGHLKVLDWNLVIAHGAFISNFSIDYLGLQKSDIRAGAVYEAIIGKGLFQEADLRHSQWSGVTIRESNFSKSLLSASKFTGVEFTCSKNNYLENDGLGCHNFSGAVFIGPEFETKYRSDKEAPLELAGVSGIEHWYIKNIKSTPTIYRFRNHLLSIGMNEEAKAITYVINKSIDSEMQESEILLQRIMAHVRQLLFDKTVKYGADPSQAFVVMVRVFIYFTVFYLILALLSGNSLFQKLFIIDVRYKDETSPLAKYLSADCQHEWHSGPSSWPHVKQFLKLAIHIIWFSLLSTFHIGWRDLNLGNWLSRVQPKPYTYEPLGLVRMLSGAQSLISIFLLSICILTSFGHPFVSLG